MILVAICILCLYFSSLVNSSNNNAAESLDSILHDHAFKALVHRRPHTGSLYNAPLPVDLSGMKVSVVRLRSRTLWSKGANFSNFRIPSRTLPMPYARRIFIVYQDLGNWSSHYYNVTGYSLISSVVGFMVYDASNLGTKNNTNLDLIATGTPISIQFPNFTFPRGTDPRTKCAKFGTNGKFSLSETSLNNVCYSRSRGHFSIVAAPKRKQRVWDLWLIGFVVGFVFIFLLGFVGKVLFKLLMVKKIHEMERETDEGVVLATIWIGNSKMPTATVTRTHPILENPDLQ